MMIKFKVESINKFIDHALPLMAEHFKEISVYSDLGFEFNLNLDCYKSLEESDLLRCFIAYDDDKIIGYAVYMVSKHLHCNAKNAMMDCVYLDKAYRSQGVGRDLIKYSEDCLIKDGVKCIMIAMGKMDFSKMLESLDYKLMDKLFYKGV